jgi:hypothetical protein
MARTEDRQISTESQHEDDYVMGLQKVLSVDKLERVWIKEFTPTEARICKSVQSRCSGSPNLTGAIRRC